jgi:4-hydroxythreonine-4-phosphate dehydrogenase
MMPRLAITMGDVAGIGPEIIVRAWPQLVAMANPVVIGDAHWLEDASALVGSLAQLQPITSMTDAHPAIDVIPFLQPYPDRLDAVSAGEVSAKAGRAAYDFLVTAIDMALRGEVDAIVTCPLHKESLHQAGVAFPGHTEILADRTKSDRHAMLLVSRDLAVAHVTLHTSMRDAVASITADGVKNAIELLHGLLPQLIGRTPRLAVCALNPHASDGGLFGDEEERLIHPAVDACRAAGVDVVGPLPADAVWLHSMNKAYDGIVAMYHDQGHIPMKMRYARQLVNVTAGLPIIRTSVAHGTAFDIAGQGVADASSLVLAADVACRLVGAASLRDRR